MPRFPSFIEDLPLTKRALSFAAEHHRGQRRESDDAAFILHGWSGMAALIPSTRPGSRVVISCNSQPLPSGSLNVANVP